MRRDGVSPCPLVVHGHGAVEPSPQAGMGTAGAQHASHAGHPEGFHAAPHPSFKDLRAEWLLPPAKQELFLYNVCFIYRLTLVFARGMTWALSYHFLLTWNYWVSEIREETQWAESIRKMFLSFPWSTENKQLLPLEGCAKPQKCQTGAPGNRLLRESQTLTILHSVCLQLFIHIAYHIHWQIPIFH